MRYNKRPLSFEAQADLLISRGLDADKSLLVERLKHVNYYRLSGYLYPYRGASESFRTGTTFQEVWRHYAFDRRLRLLVMDAIERVEVSVRTQLIYLLSHKYGAFSYTDAATLNNLTFEEHTRLLGIIGSEIERSSEKFVQHFKDKYGDNHSHLPMWIAGEIMSFGCTLTVYRGVPDDIKKAVAGNYGMPDAVMTSWLRTINVVRNICAHHSRLWNRVMGVKPFIPRRKKYPDWHHPVEIPQDRIFGILTVLRYLLQRIAPQSCWPSRLLALLDEYPDISRRSMGLPGNWQESPLWKGLKQRG